MSLLLFAVIHIVSALTLDRQIQYLEASYPSERVSEALDGYQIAFISDTHSMTADELREVVTRLDGYAPDLLLLGGDFPSESGAPERSMEILSGVKTTDGIYGVEGNHDDYTELFACPITRSRTKKAFLLYRRPHPRPLAKNKIRAHS